MKHGCDFSWIFEADCAEVIERVCVRVGAGRTDKVADDRYFRPFSITVSTAVH